MKEKGSDELSALMDGEATELEMHRVLRSADEDPEVAAKWQRYHLASAILRKEIRQCNATTLARIDLASRVSAALAEEPVLGIPEVAPAKPAAPGNSWWRPMANVAIAASVATVVVIGWQQTQAVSSKPSYSQPAMAQATTPGPVLNSTPVSASAMPAGAAVIGAMPVQYGSAVPVLQSSGMVPRGVNLQHEYVRTQKLDDERFNPYLISHSGNAAFTTHGGQLPYVRVVTLKPVDTTQR